MADKKRKVEANPAAARPAKKSKKATTSEKPTTEEASEAIAPPLTDPSKPAKKPRKRAADFLDAEPETIAPKKGKKGAISKSAKASSLTADGANGVLEHSDDEGITITTTAKSPEKSMMAEAERTVDQEMEDDFGAQEEEIDLAPALLAGFDSDNDDPAEDDKFDATRTAPLPQFKKTSKKLRQAASKTEEPGVVYIGRVPHGFYEKEMREYFSQFGTISRLRLSRNKKTGASKHFAFIEFQSDEVAKIVAETMDNYLMFGHILKCKYATAESLHPNVWVGANKRFRRIPHHKLIKEREEQSRLALTPEKAAKKIDRERLKRQKKQQQMKALGYEYDLPKLKAPEASTNGAPKSEEEVKAILPAVETPDVEGALVPPSNVPKDEVAAKVEEKVKKAKKEKKNATAPTPAEEVPAKKTKKAAAVKDVEPAVESAPVVIPEKKSKKVKTVSDAGDTVKSTAPSDKKSSAKSAATKDKVEAPAKKDKQLKGILKKPKKA